MVEHFKMAKVMLIGVPNNILISLIKILYIRDQRKPSYAH